MSRGPIICDTGALLDYLTQNAPDHRLYRSAIDSARTRYVPALVLTEVDYFLRDHRAAMRALVANIERGAFTFAPSTVNQVTRAMQVDAAFPFLKLGLVDASIVALAEELGVYRVATRDVRHFARVRTLNDRPLELVARAPST